jgi:hypothetical protein
MIYIECVNNSNVIFRIHSSKEFKRPGNPAKRRLDPCARAVQYAASTLITRF